MHTVKLEKDYKSSLGEGPVWDDETETLYWVDINGRKIHKWHVEQDDTHVYELPEKVGCFAIREQGGLVVALETGLYFFDEESEALTTIEDPEPDSAHNRFNDGKAGPDGRFYAGTMSAPVEGAASFYRLDTNLKTEQMFGNVTTSNGLAWSPDESQLYYIDTPTKQVTVFDYDRVSGDLTNGRTCITTSDSIDASPDGMAIDVEGMLWIAFYGGAAVARFNPGTGELLEKIDVPASQVTSCAFGGDNLQTLYITTARQGLTDNDLEKEPQAGGLFSYKTNVRGMPGYRFKG